MKTKLILLLLSLIFFLPGQSIGQKSVKRLYKKYKYEDNVIKFSIPGALIRMGTGIAKGFTKEPEVKELLKFSKKIKNIRVMTMEDHNPVRDADINQMLRQTRQKNFNDLVQVNEHGNRVNFLIRQGDAKMKKGKRIQGKIKNLLIVVSQDNQFTLVSMKSKFRMKELSDLINKLMRAQWDNDKEILPKKEPKPRPQV